MQLARLLDALPHKQVTRARDVAIRSIVHDSRLVQPGDMFVAIRETTGHDGHSYISSALQRGAVAIVQEHPEQASDITDSPDFINVQVPDTNYALAVLAACRYDHPADDMTLLGVTGTNGKTTVGHMVESIIKASGKGAGFIGTTGYRVHGRDLNSSHNHTTPYPDRLHGMLRSISDEGGEYTVMEVSSHALDLNRVATMSFHTGIFTNLTQDHLDYHDTIDAYKDAKLRLFSTFLSADGYGVINVDDPFAAHFAEACSGQVLTYANGKGADYWLDGNPVYGAGSTKLRINTPGGNIGLTMPLTGSYNVSNALAAIAASQSIGMPVEAIQEGLEHVSVPGRMEYVDIQQPYQVLVDFAHTPDALESVLTALRPATERRLIVVFGCGGDRDPGKRAIMGRIASRHADLAIVTSDNPRTEDPESIVAEIAMGLDTSSPYTILVNRRDAISEAISIAEPGDVVLIAGKGDETYQEIGTERTGFDDREVVKSLFGLSDHGEIR